MQQNNTLEAFKGYILHSLEDNQRRDLMYYTDDTNIEDRRYITKALNNLVESKEILRVGTAYTLNNKENDECFKKK